jgi:hypothetical protein
VVRHPTRVTCKQKCAILDDLRKLEDAGVPFPQKSLRSKHPKYSKQTISDWSRDRDRYYREVAKGRGHARHIQSGSRAHFPPEENVLYMRFVWRRQIEGFKTGDLWLRLEMADLLAASRPVGWTKFACSPGWLWLFKKRFRISSQVRTNKNMTPVAERVHLLKKFHLWLNHDLQRSEPQNSPKYGRFGPEQMFHMDQIPLPFVLDSSRSLNSIGKPVFIKMPHGSGLDKRQATIQLTIRAGGDQVVRVGLIFRGKGVRPKAAEPKVYRELAGVAQVYFQPNAWADEKVMLKWLDEFHEDTKDLGLGEVLLGMDNHGAQQTDKFRERMQLYNIVPAYTPPDCTDVVAPCDHHVGAHLKKLVGAYYHMTWRRIKPDGVILQPQVVWRPSRGGS